MFFIFQREKGSAGGGGFQRGRRGLADGDDDSGRKKKVELDHRFSRSNSGSTTFRSN